MIAQALKHFLVVGLMSALGVGWVLTLGVNTLLWYALNAALRGSADEPYWVALLLTVVSMSLIAGATVLGSHVFRRYVAADGVGGRSLAVSSLLFLGVVLVFVVPELARLMRLFMTHMNRTYENPGDVWLMLSLPLLRVVGLPLIYVLIGRRCVLTPRGVSSALTAA